MFGQLNNSQNHESGMVLVTVLMIVIVLMILSVSILSQHMTQSNSSQAQIDQIRADEFAKGVFWNAHSSGSFTPGTTVLGTYGGRTYSSTVTTLGTLANVQISY
jgi:hypothetical protein